MIFKINPQSQLCPIKSSALLLSPYPRRSSALLRLSNSASIQAEISTSSSLQGLHLSWGASFNRGFSRQARQKVDQRIVGDSASQLPVRASSMPTPVGSASFYPIKGLYFFRDPANRTVLWKRIAKFAAEVGAATAVVFGSLIGFTWHAQKSLLLQLLPHSLHLLGTPGTIVLICIETAIPLSMIFYNRTRRVQEKLFVDVLSLQGITVEKSSAEEKEWIHEQRALQRRQEPKRGFIRSLADPESLSNRPITKYLVTLPLNFIPVAGQAAYCWVNSMDTATMLHHYYYSKMKGLSAEEEAAVIHFRKAQYQQFGVTATMMDLFPGANIVFVLTNAVGAALWAADLEKAMQKQRLK